MILITIFKKNLFLDEKIFSKYKNLFLGGESQLDREHKNIDYSSD